MDFYASDSVDHSHRPAMFGRFHLAGHVRNFFADSGIAYGRDRFDHRRGSRRSFAMERSLTGIRNA
jgi:hypothetical protein